MKLPVFKRSQRGKRVRSGLLSVFVMPMLLTPFSAIAKDDAKMRIGGRTTQPIGHYEYCQRELRDCQRISLNTAPRVLTRERWKEVLTVNLKANSSIRPVTDMEYFGVKEHWTLPDYSATEGLSGDCEDYVLAKRLELMEMGWPAATLLPTVVRRPNGEGHAVLTVRTNRGDFILDNLTDAVLAWNETPYAYLKRVSAAHSGRWETIIDSRTLVSSISN